jgi:NADPH:quinone reductase-like Zn-dependent oxidoreductase
MAAALIVPSRSGGPGAIAVSLSALAVGGHVSLIGASLSPSGAGLDPLLLTGRGITLGSISVGSRADFEAMNRAIAMRHLPPVIDRTFPFAEAKEAYRHFEAAMGSDELGIRGVASPPS